MTKQQSNKVKHVFVLMLENHSFDNIFAGSGIPGIQVAPLTNFNIYKGAQYFVNGGAPSSMPTDPGHEFEDVVEQLCGAKKVISNGVYPPIRNSGFAYNYATSDSEKSGLPKQPQIADIMKHFDTANDLPPTYQLATEFAICDNWFSSIPGPTWPNRFFVHGGSSAGLDHSPTNEQMGYWESWFSNGFEYEHGSIFDLLKSKNIDWKIFIDEKGYRIGAIPQTSSIHNIKHNYVGYVSDMIQSLKNNTYNASYTFIEPNYGDVVNNYIGGTSQHPMDGVSGGEGLIKRVYEAIRSSNIWNESMLIITYDEHGGFYDSVKPPKAVPPGDKTMDPTYNQFGFKFDQLGVRVPAIVVSPFIQKNTVDHTVYDHTSVIATLNQLFEIGNLTNRDLYANNVLSSLVLTNPRRDCPKILNNPAKQKKVAKLTATQKAKVDKMPLPQSGNLIGFLMILLKTKIEITKPNKKEKTLMIQEFKQLKTRGEARIYAEKILALLDEVRK